MKTLLIAIFVFVTSAFATANENIYFSRSVPEMYFQIDFLNSKNAPSRTELVSAIRDAISTYRLPDGVYGAGYQETSAAENATHALVIDALQVSLKGDVWTLDAHVSQDSGSFPTLSSNGVLQGKMKEWNRPTFIEAVHTAFNRAIEKLPLFVKF